jgi:hypothetical protein
VKHGAGHKGKLPPVVERASSGCAGHVGDGSGIARGREGFWFEGQRSAKKHGEVENHEAHNDTTKKAVGCLSNARA